MYIITMLYLAIIIMGIKAYRLKHLLENCTMFPNAIQVEFICKLYLYASIFFFFYYTYYLLNVSVY